MQKFLDAIAALNEFLGTPYEEPEEPTNKQRMEAFMEAVETVPPDDEGGIPEHVVEMYNLFREEGEKVLKPKLDKKVVPAKAVPAKAVPAKAVPAKAAKAIVPAKAAKAAPVKAAPAPAPKKVVAKPTAVEKPTVAKVAKVAKEKTAAELSRYGHRVGSMAARIDDLLWEGTTLTAAVKTLAKEFNRDEDKAKAKFLGHVQYLPSVKSIEITKPEDEKGNYKAKKAKI